LGHHSFRHRTTGNAPSEKICCEEGVMLRHHQIHGLVCAVFGATGLLLTSCSQNQIEPAPVSFRGVNRAVNSTAPVAAAPFAAPRLATASPPLAAASSHAQRAIPSRHASGGAVIKGKRSAGAEKVHRHRAPPQIAGAVSGKQGLTSPAKPATSAAALAGSHRETIPLDEPITTSAEQTTSAWVQPTPAEAPQSQSRPPVP
jgi:hypothetical protein